MPNIGALLRQEISRLSRREARSQGQTTKKASVQHRRDIAALKREVGALKHQIALLLRQTLRTPTTSPITTTKVRFVAKGVRSQRNRLGLSAEDYGKLVGVSPQSIYNWEQGNTTPRAEQVKAIAALRGIGKREAARRLKEAGSKGAKKARKR